MTIIYLVRHGQTDLVGKKLCGTIPGIPLNEEGLQGAARAAEYLSARPIQAIYSSPVQRASETARIIGSRLSLPVTAVDFLSEIHFGDLQGMDIKDLMNLPIWIQLYEHPSDVRFPNGESIEEVFERATNGLTSLNEKYQPQDEILCVSHSGLLRLAICGFLGLPVDYFHRISVDLVSVSKLVWNNEYRRLKLLNYLPD